ncbi:MAG: MFS transporter [Pseudomonadota bacterium]
MTSTAKSPQTADDPLAILAIVLVSVFAYAGFLGIPIFVGMMVDQLDFSDGQAGYVSSAEQFGILIAAVSVAVLVNRQNRRTLVAVALVVCAVAALASLSVTEFVPMLVARFLGGVGEGAVYATAVAILAGSNNSARNFTYIIVAIAASNVAIFWFFPIVGAQYGIAATYGVLAILSIVGLAFVRWLPAYFETGKRAVAHNDTRFPPSLAFVCLAAVVCFYFMCGGSWTYIERIGVNLGNTPEWVGRYLGYGVLFSLLGCVIAYWASRRFGQSRPLIVSLLAVTVCLFLFAQNMTTLSWFLSTAAVYLFWNAIDIYQLGTLANLDSSGRYCALTPASQGIGMTLGPATAAYYLDQGASYAIVPYLGAAACLVALMLYLYVHFRIKAIDPSMAARG